MDRRPDIDEEEKNYPKYQKFLGKNLAPGVKRSPAEGQAERHAKRLRSNGNPDSQAYKVRWGLPYPLAPEKKFYDQSFDLDPLVDGGVNFLTSSLTPIAAGTAESERIGRKIIVTNIHVRCYIGIPGQVSTSLADLDNGNVRMLVVLDKQCNGALPTDEDLWAGGIFAGKINQYRQLTTVGRFEFLHDEFVDIHHRAGGCSTSGGTTTFMTTACHIGWSANLKCSIPIEYSGTAGLLGEHVSNNILVIALARGDKLSVILSQARVRYIDQ